jgi:hypothetical protein
LLGSRPTAGAFPPDSDRSIALARGLQVAPSPSTKEVLAVTRAAIGAAWHDDQTDINRKGHKGAAADCTEAFLVVAASEYPDMASILNFSGEQTGEGKQIADGKKVADGKQLVKNQRSPENGNPPSDPANPNGAMPELGPGNPGIARGANSSLSDPALVGISTGLVPAPVTTLLTTTESLTQPITPITGVRAQ